MLRKERFVQSVSERKTLCSLAAITAASVEPCAVRTNRNLSAERFDPEAYLRHILSVQPECPSYRVDELLPWNVVFTDK